MLDVLGVQYPNQVMYSQWVLVTPKKKIPNGHHGHSSKAKKNPQKWNNHICKQGLIKVHWKLE
jgi:hypothetical protein